MLVFKNGTLAPKDNDADWDDFIRTGVLSEEQEQIAREALDRLCREYPVFTNCVGNREELTTFLLSQKKLPRWDTVRRAFLELAPTGRLLLDVSRVGIMRFGEDGITWQVEKLTADELKLITTRFRPRSENEIRDMTADEYYKSEHGRVLREERNRRADDAIRQQELRQAKAAVSFFLAANRDYARTDANMEKMLAWLEQRNLPMNRTSLQQAFDGLRATGDLALTADHNAEYGATRFVDYSDFGETNPMRERPPVQHVDLVEQKSVKKITMADVRKMSSEQFEAALKDTDLGPQINALLENS